MIFCFHPVVASFTELVCEVFGGTFEDEPAEGVGPLVCTGDAVGFDEGSNEPEHDLAANSCLRISRAQ
jgi:hypothetical protein